MSEAPIAVLLADGTLLRGNDFEPVEHREGVLRCTRPDILMRVSISSTARHGGMMHQLSVQNTGFGRIALARLSPLYLVGADAAPEGLEGVSLLLESGTTDGGVRCHRFTAVTAGAEQCFTSELALVSGEPGGDQQTLLGFVTTREQFASIRLTTGPEQTPQLLDCGCEVDGVVLGPGEMMRSEALLILGPGREVELLEQYAAALATEMQAPPPPSLPALWRLPAESQLEAALAALQQQALPVETVEFGRDIEASTAAQAAARIHAAGYRPALRLAPLAEIDCDDPAALARLREQVHQATQAWGYGLLHVDIPAQGCSASNANRRRARSGKLRGVLQALREGAGEALLLAEGAFEPALGVVDAMHVAGEPSAALARFWLQGRIWRNVAPLQLQANGEPLPLEEARLRASAVALSAATPLIDADPTMLTSEQWQALAATLPPLSDAARPLDLLEHETASLYSLRLQRGTEVWHLLAAFNWGSERAAWELDLGRLELSGPVHAFEFWEGRWQGHVSSALPLRLSPRSCRVYALRPAQERLQLLSVSGHISQGSAQLETAVSPDERTLVLRLAETWTRPARAWLRMPPGSSVLLVQPTGLTLTASGGLVSAGLDFAVTREWILRAL